MRITKLNHLLPRFFSIIFSIIFIWLTLSVIFAPRSAIFVPNPLLETAIVILSLLLCAALIFLIGKIPESIRKNILLYRISIALAIISMLAVHLWIGLSLQPLVIGEGWDPKLVIEDAIHLADNTTTQHSDYFLLNQNNITVLAVLSGVFKLTSLMGIHDYNTVAIILNILSMNTAIVILYLTAVKIFGRRIGVISLLFSFFFFTLSFWSTTPYTDTLTLWVPILVFYIYIHLRSARAINTKILLLLALVITTVVGYELKPTTIIMPMAILVFLIFEYSYNFVRKPKRDKIINTNSLLVISGCLFFFILHALSLHLINVSQVISFNLPASSNESRPMSHFMMMGLKTSYRDYPRPLYGAYSLEDDLLTTSGRRDGSSHEIAISEIKKRLADMGALGYISFLNNKAVWIMSDGTFYAYGEGLAMNAQVQYVNKSFQNRVIQHLLGKDGKLYPITSNVIHGVWVALLLLICLQSLAILRSHRPVNYTHLITIQLSLAGIIAFVLLFEGRSRYLYNFLPLFIIAGLYGIYIIQDLKKIYKRNK